MLDSPSPSADLVSLAHEHENSFCLFLRHAIDPELANALNGFFVMLEVSEPLICKEVKKHVGRHPPISGRAGLRNFAVKRKYDEAFRKFSQRSAMDSRFHQPGFGQP